MPDAARAWLEKYDKVLKRLSKSPVDGEHSAVSHLRRLLEQNERLEADLLAHKENEGDECPLCKLEADNAALKKRVVELDSWGEELEQENQRLRELEILAKEWYLRKKDYEENKNLGTAQYLTQQKDTLFQFLEGGDDTISSQEALEMDDDEWIGFLGIGGDDE